MPDILSYLTVKDTPCTELDVMINSSCLFVWAILGTQVQDQGKKNCLSLLLQEILSQRSETWNNNVNIQLHEKSLSNAKLCDVWNCEAYVMKHRARKYKCALQFLCTSKWYHCYLRSINTAIKLSNACSKLHDQASNWVPTECRSAAQQLMCRLQVPCEHQCGSNYA
jgi:hypothetical protein